VQRVTDQVESRYLEQAPPRSLPHVVILNLLGDYIFERPLSAFLDPLLICAILALIGLITLHANTLLWFVPLLVIMVRTALGARRVWRRAWDDLMLLRNGLALRAHVLRMRPHRNIAGEINGALLDCAIPVAPRRTYVGSVWLADGSEAQRLVRQGRITVICLPRTPGTWRIIEAVASEVRYERMGALQQVPLDI
jgi:hypothetical protein